VDAETQRAETQRIMQAKAGRAMHMHVALVLLLVLSVLSYAYGLAWHTAHTAHSGYGGYGGRWRAVRRAGSLGSTHIGKWSYLAGPVTPVPAGRGLAAGSGVEADTKADAKTDADAKAMADSDADEAKAKAQTQTQCDTLFVIPNSPASLDSVVLFVQNWAREQADTGPAIRATVSDGGGGGWYSGIVV
jgi:hypothetical protein